MAKTVINNLAQFHISFFTFVANHNLFLLHLMLVVTWCEWYYVESDVIVDIMSASSNPIQLNLCVNQLHMSTQCLY